jgi:hypothetical protein
MGKKSMKVERIIEDYITDEVKTKLVLALLTSMNNPPIPCLTEISLACTRIALKNQPKK